MKIERNSQESKALDLMRFPLAILIVLLHTGADCGPDDFTYYIAKYVNAPIVKLAVPTFFFISGYLFFIGKEQFTVTVYKKTLTKKIRGLLVPYIFWNYIALILSYAYNFLKTGSIGDVMPWEVITILWGNGEGGMGRSLFGYEYPVIVSPVAGVLWFMRDLMMMMLCAVIMYKIILCTKKWFFLIVLVMNLFGLGIPFTGFSLSAITFFYSGAYFSIHQINVFTWLDKHRVFWVLLWPCSVILQMLLATFSLEISNRLSVLVLSAGVVFIFELAYICANKRKKIYGIVSNLGETSFFIYTFGNTLILWLINKNIGYMLYAIPHYGVFLCYEFLFIAKIVECVFVYYFLKRCAPKVLSIITGGRLK